MALKLLGSISGQIARSHASNSDLGSLGQTGKGRVGSCVSHLVPKHYLRISSRHLFLLTHSSDHTLTKITQSVVDWDP